MSIRSPFLGIFLTTLVGITGSVMASTPHPEETAALQHQQNAEAAMKGQNFALAAAEYLKAAKLVPDSGEYQLKLANAYVANNQIGEAWFALRKAATLRPADKPTSDLFSRFWNMFDKQGLFNVGQPVEKVVKLLGKPDQRVQVGDRDRLVYGFYSVDAKQRHVHELLDLRGLKSRHMTPTEIVLVDLDGRGWRSNYRVNNQLVATSEYVLPEEQIQNWTELVSIQRLHGQATTGLSLKQVVEGMMSTLKKSNPDRQYRILDQEEASILFEWKTRGGKGSAAQHELVRMFYGPRDMHRLAYVQKTNELSETAREKWVGILRAASLQSVEGSTQQASNSQSGSGEVRKTAASTAETRKLAWELGSRLSGAAIMHSQGADAKRTMSTFKLADAAAEKLGLKLESLPSLVEEEQKNTLNCVTYLMAETGRTLHGQLTAKFDRSHAALLESAIKSNMLMLMYVPNDSTGKALGTALNDRRADAGLPGMLLQTLLQNIEKGADRKLIVMNVLKLHTDVKLLLEKAAKEPSNPNVEHVLNQLQGVWKSIRVEGKEEFDLTPAGESVIVIEDNRVSFVAKDQKTITATFEIDATVSPMRIEWLYPAEEGNDAERITEIFKLDGETLSFCGDSEDNVPADFSVPEGSDRVLTVYKKLRS